MKKDRTICSYVLKKALYALVFLVAFVIFARGADAATLYFNPSSDTYGVGEQFSVSIFLSTLDEVNALSGDLLFSSDLVDIVSITEEDTIVGFWVQGPPQIEGNKIDFKGLILEGYSGDTGKILTLTFKAQKVGTVDLQFSSGSSFANNGEGTELPTNLESAQFTILEAPEIPPEEVEEDEEVEEVEDILEELLFDEPIISSPTHPDQTEWYTDNSPVFIWELPENATNIRIDISESIIPDLENAFPVEDVDTYTFPEVTDGIKHFHTFFDLEGEEGRGITTSYQVSIDTQPPTNLSVTESQPSFIRGFRSQFNLTADDATSGVSHYEITIDGQFIETWRDDGSNLYTTPPLSVGEHTIQIKVFDQAGNSTEESFAFTTQVPYQLYALFVFAALIGGVVLIIISIEVKRFRRRQ